MNGYNVMVYEPKDMRKHPVWKLLGGRTIAFRKVHVDLTGSVTAALMLAQALYWSEKTNDPSGWFYKSAKEWTEETGLSVQEQRTARKKLCEFSWWQEDKRKVNGAPTIHYRVNPIELINHASEMLEATNGNVGSNKSMEMLEATNPIYIDDQQMTDTTNGVGGVQEDCSNDNPYSLKEVYRFYENNFTTLTSFLSEAIAYTYEEYPSDWIVEAMEIALKNSRRKWSYVEGILKRWHTEGKQDARKQESAQPKMQAVLLEDAL